jgi:hypothetical protein
VESLVIIDRALMANNYTMGGFQGKRTKGLEENRRIMGLFGLTYLSLSTGISFVRLFGRTYENS